MNSLYRGAENKYTGGSIYLCLIVNLDFAFKDVLFFKVCMSRRGHFSYVKDDKTIIVGTILTTSNSVQLLNFSKKYVLTL